MSSARVRLRDATLREGLDTPNVTFSPEQRVRIARALVNAGVVEVEVVAPSRVVSDLAVVRRLKDEGLPLRTSGLVYANSPDCARDLDAAASVLDHIDLLMPASPLRDPAEPGEKLRVLDSALSHARGLGGSLGAGFPHSFQCDAGFLAEMVVAAVSGGARRIVVYDTNGGADPATVTARIRAVRDAAPGVEVYFHAHNDLGMATANALAAVVAGANGLDVTVNGLGDRAGNVPLEQIAVVLHLRGMETGVRLDALCELSALVERESGVAVSRLAPVVGAYALWHKSPGHLRKPGLFEAFDPGLVRAERRVDEEA